MIYTTPSKAVIVIPTYNERENIVRLFEKIIKVRKKIKGWDISILVVDDNSPDGTSTVVKSYARRVRGIFLLLRHKKTGLGAAYFAGMRQAFVKMRAQLVITMDADLSHNPSYLPEFIREVEQGADFVVGSRYIRGGAIAREWAFHRKFLSVFGNLMVILLLGTRQLSDWTSGYRALRKTVFEKIGPLVAQRKEFRGYTFNISFAFHAVSANFKTSEVPIKFIDRTSGKSKLGLEYLYHTPFFLFKTRLKRLLNIYFV